MLLQFVDIAYRHAAPAKQTLRNFFLHLLSDFAILIAKIFKGGKNTMELFICAHGQEFLDRYEPRMAEHEVVYQLILGNAYANAKSPANKDCFFGAVLDDQQQPLFLFGHVAPYRLLMYALSSPSAAGAVHLLFQYIEEQHIEISGILASAQICDLYLACDKNRRYQRGHRMDVMELRSVNEFPLSPGRFRKASAHDLELLADYAIGFHQDVGLVVSENEWEKAYEKRKDLLASDSLYVYETPEGQIASTAYVARRLSHGCCLSGVYTHPSCRGRGYCASMMQLIAKDLLAGGAEYLGLYVDQENPISNHTYKKVGYRILVDSVEYDRLP